MMYSPDDSIQLVQVAQEILKSNKDTYPERIQEIRAIIDFADWTYYIQDDPVLADSEYDQLFSILKNTEKKFPELIIPNSPTQRIALGLSEQFQTVPHLVPMLSLDNSFNAADLIDWDRKCKSLSDNETITYTVEPKYDGAGISLVYENNLLQRGATRGDGISGEEITVNVKQIKSIPLFANFSHENIESLEIRGEVLIPKSSFLKYNEQRTASGLSILANPRNAASGTLRMLDPNAVRERNLKAIVYHVSYHQNLINQEDSEILLSHYDTLKWLSKNGFATPIHEMKRCTDIQEVIDFCLEFEQKRDELDYEIDGMVIKVDSIPLQEKMGMTTHHPRWAIAYKFKARQGTSKLLNVDFQVGRTGAITPVAKIEPVAIGGVMVSSVSLFNEDIINEKDLRTGDSILVERAGDVIPYIVKSFPELRTGSEEKIKFPKDCPICSEALLKPVGEVAWRCINALCPAQTIEHLIHYASKNAMDIRNLGEANIKRFYSLGLLKDILGIYNLDFDRISQLDKFGEKSIANLKEAIEKSKNQSLNRLIFGLGIRYVGETTAKTLANAVNHILDLKEWTEEQLFTLEDIGPKVANSVIQFFQRTENIQLLEELEKIGVNVSNQKTKESIDDLPFVGQTFLFTGTLSHFKRTDAEEIVEAKGGKILNSVSSKLTWLIVGEKAGSKLERAKKIGTVKILTEKEFMELVGDW